MNYRVNRKKEQLEQVLSGAPCTPVPGITQKLLSKSETLDVAVVFVCSDAGFFQPDSCLNNNGIALNGGDQVCGDDKQRQDFSKQVGEMATIQHIDLQEPHISTAWLLC